MILKRGRKKHLSKCFKLRNPLTKKEITRVPAHKRIKVHQRGIGYKVPLEILDITKSSHASSCKRPEKEINREIPERNRKKYVWKWAPKDSHVIPANVRMWLGSKMFKSVVPGVPRRLSRAGETKLNIKGCSGKEAAAGTRRGKGSYSRTTRRPTTYIGQAFRGSCGHFQG